MFHQNVFRPYAISLHAGIVKYDIGVKLVIPSAI
jgi:hypothetical protein